MDIFLLYNMWTTPNEQSIEHSLCFGVRKLHQNDKTVSPLRF